MRHGWILLCGVALAFGVRACSVYSPEISGPGAITSVSESPQPSPLLSLSLTRSPLPAPDTATPTPSRTPEGNSKPTNEPVDIVPASTVVTLTPTALACWDEGGHYEHAELSVEELPLPLSFRLYLPPCYQQQPERTYPVIYLIHGQHYSDAQWDRLGADEVADALILAGEIPPIIIVMPRERSWILPPENKFDLAVAEQLVPWIDDHYRTLPERQYRAVGGLSRGANWALRLGLVYWNTFASIGGHSLPVFVTDGPRVPDWLDAIPPQDLPRIYLDMGERDSFGEYGYWFADLLNERGIPHEWHLFPGSHNEAYWAAHVEQYLLWYAGEW